MKHYLGGSISPPVTMFLTSINVMLLLSRPHHQGGPHRKQHLVSIPMQRNDVVDKLHVGLDCHKSSEFCRSVLLQQLHSMKLFTYSFFGIVNIYICSTYFIFGYTPQQPSIVYSLFLSIQNTISQSTLAFTTTQIPVVFFLLFIKCVDEQC